MRLLEVLAEILYMAPEDLGEFLWDEVFVRLLDALDTWLGV